VKNNLDDNNSLCGFVKPRANIATHISSMTAGKMAEGVSGPAFSSDKLSPNRSEVININCSNCLILNEQPQLALQELESAKTIISLLRDDNNLTSAPSVSDNLMPSVTSSANIHDHGDMNWIPVRHKDHKKTKSSYNIAGKVEMSPLSSNRFSPLDNLKVNREDEVISVINKVNLSTTSTMKNATRQQIGINKIPTIINGRVISKIPLKQSSNHHVLNLISLPDVIIKFI